MIYAGIGSRETPPYVLDIFEKLGEWLSNKGDILRSGHAPGADYAFEQGCIKANGKSEIYLPWKNFNSSNSTLILKSNDRARIIAKKYHPQYNILSPGAKKLQARNSYQILGYDLNTPADFVLCWTSGGSGFGGTGQALRIAKHYNIPIFDFGCYEDVDIMRKEFLKFYTSFKN